MNYIVHPGIIQADFYKFCNKAYTKNGRMYDPALGRFLSPYPIRSHHSGPFTYEVEEKEGGTKSLSLSVKKYYLSVGYGENGLSIGSGVNKGNFSIGFEQKVPSSIFKVLILLYLPELAPRIAPTLIPLNSIRYSW